MRLLKVLVVLGLASGCATKRVYRNYLDSVVLTPSSRPLPAEYEAARQVSAQACDSPDRRVEVQDLISSAQGTHDALVQITIQKRIEEVWTMALWNRMLYLDSRVICFELDALAVDLRSEIASPDESSRPSPTTTVSAHPGLRALTGWGELAWGSPPPRDLRMVGVEGSFDIGRPDDTTGVIWGLEVNQVRLHYRAGRLTQVRFRLPNGADRSRLIEEVGQPTETGDTTKWTGTTTEVVLDGRQVTIRGWGQAPATE